MVNWMKRHLNLTLILSTTFFTIITFSAIFLFNYLRPETWIEDIIGIPIIIGWITLSGWILRQKGRSLGWLLFALPLLVYAVIIWCLLSNKRGSLERRT